MTKDQIIERLSIISELCKAEGDDSPFSDEIIEFVEEQDLTIKAYSDAIDRLQQELRQLKPNS